MSDRLALLSFPGITAAGPINLLGANPGDVIQSVVTVTTSGLGTDYTSSFMREIQYLGEVSVPAGGPFGQVIQINNTNLSSLTFVALVKRKTGNDQP